MTRFPLTGRYSSLCVLLTLFWLSGQSLPVRAEKIYSPVPLILNKEINDTLTDKDIPTGEGGVCQRLYRRFGKGRSGGHRSEIGKL
jgi:hypothetical protein